MSVALRVSATNCRTCASIDRKGYCALGRCYCGHTTCHAFASWTELPALAEVAPAPRKAPTSGSSWDTREDSTWLDKM